MNSDDRNDDGEYPSRDQYRIELVGYDGGERPVIAIQAIGAGGEVLHAESVDDDGGFRLPPEILAKARTIVIGAADTSDGVLPRNALSYRAKDFASQVNDGVFAIAEPVWSRFRFIWSCVSGSVRVCRHRQWWYDSVVASSTIDTRSASSAKTIGFADSRAFATAASSIGELLAWPVRCAPVCAGTVEVYRRTCCCTPIVIDPRQVYDVIRDLDRYVAQLPKYPIPKIKFPPPPPPPLGDPLRTPYFRGGALNEFALNARIDAENLRTLPLPQAAQYIEARPYLYHRLCSCSAPVRMGIGALTDDGTFNVCWLDSLRLYRPNCSDQFAYVVKQTIAGVTTTIYDGVVAGAWFAGSDQPVLTSYHSHAMSCNETGGDGTAFVYLDLVGATESYELITPNQTGWDRVAAPVADSGLLFPIAGAGGHLRNLGGAIDLTFIFSLAMREAAVGAKYYRVGITKADAAGQPIGPRSYFRTGLAWDKVVGLDIVPTSLGPNSVGNEDNLYLIPYSDEPWVGTVRYHAYIDTTTAALDPIAATAPPDLTSTAAKHLITLEVFDALGHRLRPSSSPATGLPGTEHARPFQYRRQVQAAGTPGNDLDPVPFAALTHMMCWDNRPPVADITGLRQDGAESSEECQFLVGPGSSTFAIEYRAYVAEARFQQQHTIDWLRGLNSTNTNGGQGSLPTASPANVGKPPAGPQPSGTNTFAQMLTRREPLPATVLERCSFAVTLTTFSKTTNGANFDYPHVSETAAFALQIAPFPGNPSVVPVLP